MVQAVVHFYQDVVMDCPLCSGKLVVIHCKLVCPWCHLIVENCNGD